MKKKNIIQIIIGIILIVGIGYAFYSEIERNKEDYFLIETKKSKKEIDKLLKENGMTEIHSWKNTVDGSYILGFEEKKDYMYIKIKTKVKTYEQLKNEKEMNIRYVNLIEGNECMQLEKNEQCKIIYSSDTSSKEKEQIREYFKEKLFNGEVGLDNRKIEQIKKHPKVKKISKYIMFGGPEDSVS